MRSSELHLEKDAVVIPAGGPLLEGNLEIPRNATGVVLFAHGSGSSRFSPRNRRVAASLNEVGLGTLLVDLLSPSEESLDNETGELRFNIEFLASRLTAVIDWLKHNESTEHLEIGLFGSSTGGGAALVSAVECGDDVAAVVSRGGRPDLAGDCLRAVECPVLLIVGGHDYQVIDLNRAAFEELRCTKVMEIVPGATHLFEEPGALEEVAHLARAWFQRYLMPK